MIEMHNIYPWIHISVWALFSIIPKTHLSFSYLVTFNYHVAFSYHGDLMYEINLDLLLYGLNRYSNKPFLIVIKKTTRFFLFFCPKTLIIVDKNKYNSHFTYKAILILKGQCHKISCNRFTKSREKLHINICFCLYWNFKSFFFRNWFFDFLAYAI